METGLSQIQSLPQKDKTNRLIDLLSSTLQTSNSIETDLSNFLDFILSPDFPQIIARQTLSEYVTRLKEISDVETRKQVMATSLTKLQSRVTTFEEQVGTIREEYADLLEADEDFTEAAKVLIGIPLESGNRATEYKLRVYIRIVRLFLEEADSTSAETYFNRASLMIHETQEISLQLSFKLCAARMFDYNRKFVEAASKYHELSFVAQIDQGERLQALSAAISCAILAPAGPQRSRVLANLFRDERANSTAHYSILSKMFLDHLIKPDEVQDFAKTLSEHQLAKLPAVTAIVTAEDSPETGKKGPETVLDRAVMEHNVLACSKVYNNITFSGLGLLLGVRPSAAELMARTMIQQRRLFAQIDQVENLIIFDVESKEGDGVISNVAAAAAAAGLQQDDVTKEEQSFAPAMKRWDAQIRQSLQSVESIAARCEVLLKKGILETPVTASAITT